jgi:hypothetical protein
MGLSTLCPVSQTKPLQRPVSAARALLPAGRALLALRREPREREFLVDWALSVRKLELRHRSELPQATTASVSGDRATRVPGVPLLRELMLERWRLARACEGEPLMSATRQRGCPTSAP